VNPHRPSDWALERDDHGVTARIGDRPVAHVEVRDADARVRLEFWMDERLPHELRTDLTRTVFDHPALRPCRPVSVAWPHRQTDVLQEVRRHVPDARIHVAGATCLLDGHISPAGRPSAHPGGTTDHPGASPAGGAGGPHVLRHAICPVVVIREDRLRDGGETAVGAARELVR
jgi:hypothetical protein